MHTERKILPVVKKLSFKEAEEADHVYWANASVERRLEELIALRIMFFGDADRKIKKVVSKRKRYANRD